MKIRIENKVPTATGNWSNKVVMCKSFEEADLICNKCDQIGYPVVDVTREE